MMPYGYYPMPNIPEQNTPEKTEEPAPDPKKPVWAKKEEKSSDKDIPDWMKKDSPKKRAENKSFF